MLFGHDNSIIELDPLNVDVILVAPFYQLFCMGMEVLFFKVVWQPEAQQTLNKYREELIILNISKF